jgi:hypothetical protein
MSFLIGWPRGRAPYGCKDLAPRTFCVNATHILGIGLIGAILPLDLRLIGLLSSPPLETVAPFLLRAASIGLALAP